MSPARALQAARRLGGDVAVLNFASARNPGGEHGLNGAQPAEEEALCRPPPCTPPACCRAREFYDHHRAHRDPFYTTKRRPSPGVPVFRDDRGRLLAAPFAAGFLTCAAPNAGVVLRTASERAADLPAALTARAGRVLETAVTHGHRRLVLGAWGCGVFRNDPARVAGRSGRCSDPADGSPVPSNGWRSASWTAPRAPPSGRPSSAPSRRAAGRPGQLQP